MLELRRCVLALLYLSAVTGWVSSPHAVQLRGMPLSAITHSDRPVVSLQPRSMFCVHAEDRLPGLHLLD